MKFGLLLPAAAMLAALSAPAATAGDCEQTLKALRIQEQIISGQLDKTLQETTSIDGTKSVNKVYEQLMLSKVHLIAQIQSAEERCEAEKSAGNENGKESRKIRKLRKEVDELKSTIIDLTRENQQLRSQVQALQTGAEISQTYCVDRMDKMARKLDALQTLGYVESHPDVVNTRAQITEIRAECSGASSASACADRLADLQEKADRLKSLGYNNRHPDVRNINAQIKVVKRECRAAGSGR